MSTLTLGLALKPREDTVLPSRIARSAAATTGAWLRTEDFADWLEQRRRAHQFEVERIPFAELDGWFFQQDTGDLVHHSGRFFSVQGLHVTTGDGAVRDWHQPVISQPEVGILGILVKEFDGVLHFLMQAKMEPGNPNLLQLSPTVQATRSNYTKVHKGADVKYIEYFTDPRRGRVHADVLQSEHGSWFLHKSNRNMIVEAVGDVPCTTTSAGSPSARSASSCTGTTSSTWTRAPSCPARPSRTRRTVPCTPTRSCCPGSPPNAPATT